ncbi:MAG: glucose-1-phosphate adenylyltransferase [Vicinamibacterales bacterium]|nr:glucose-1-phosphate adenylyltransferase [Vicinamibacterales bacterium]
MILLRRLRMVLRAGGWTEARVKRYAYRMRNVLAIILGGGQGTRLFPLTQLRSKPAVPIGGKYRLIDVPISNCLHADLRRIFVLTQFNSASLNRHVSNAYRMDLFSRGFIEILAAEQTPESTTWFQGTADAVRKARRHFEQYDAEYYLILAGDHLYRMDYAELLASHLERRADITLAALPVSPADATGMGIFRFDARGQIDGFEEKPDAARLAQIGASLPTGSVLGPPDAEKPFIASMGIYLFSRDVLLTLLEQEAGMDFARALIPAALNQYRVSAFLHKDYWADVGTIESFYDANIMLTSPGAPFSFYDPRRPMYTHPRFLPPLKAFGCTLHNALVAEGGFLDRCRIEDSVVGIRAHVGDETEVRRSVLLGADAYEDLAASEAHPSGIPLGIGRRAVLDRVIVDKNARIGDEVRLVNTRGVDHEDGDGYCIRGGIIIVPKGGVIPAGTVV